MSNPILWTPGVTLESLIEQVIESAFHHYRGNKTATANSLGIAVRTLENRMEKYKKQKEEHVERAEHARRKREEFLRRQRAVPGAARFDTSATPSPHEPDVRARAQTSVAAKSRMGSQPAKKLPAQ